MSQNRQELKVGLFVFIGLALIVFLLILFSKGLSFAPTVTLRLHAQSAGILKSRTFVQMSGVPVGSISKIELAPDGKSVTIFLKIEKKYEVHRDARFVIEQSGFLGDQYVSIIPNGNTGPLLVDGDEVSAEPPFDLQEVARAAQGFIKRIDETAQRLNETIADVRREVLNDTTLSNLAVSVTTLRQFSEQALVAADNVNALVSTNAAPITTAVANINSATASLTNLLNDIQSGKGLAGRVIEDPQLADSLSQMTANLSATSSNLNRFGLWHVLWKKHPPLTNSPALSTPKK
jgi:phospholipid/cholesterol/gamma-HCH transport system substrate-binding protein